MKLNKLFGETIIYGIGAILPRVITFLLTPLYIHYIDPSSFAIFTSMYAWIAFVNIMLSFGFETAYFRFCADNPQEKVFNTAFWFVFSLASSFLVLVMLFNQPLAQLLDYGQHPEFLRWFACIAFFDAICIIPFAWLRYHNKPIRYSVIRVSAILLQTLIVLSLFMFIPASVSEGFGLTSQVSYPFFSNLIASVFIALLLSPIILKAQFRFDTALFKKMITYAYPIMFAGLAFMVNENFDKIYQYYNIPKEHAGAYGGCYKLAVLMTLFVTAYRMGVEPFFFKQMKKADAKESYAKVTEYFTVFASVAALGIIANIAWLKRLFITDESFWIAMPIVPIIIIANLFFGVYYNLSTWYKVTDRTRVGMYLSWFGASLTIGLHLLLLKEYGFIASAWITFVVYLSMMVVSYFLGQKYYPIPYATKKIGLFLGVLIGFTLIIVTVLEHNFWLSNVLLLAFMGLAGFMYKDMLQGLVSGVLAKVRKA